MFCTKCGKQLNPDAKFCVYCGAPVAQSARQPAETKPPRSRVIPSDDLQRPSAQTPPAPVKSEQPTPTPVHVWQTNEAPANQAPVYPMPDPGDPTYLSSVIGRNTGYYLPEFRKLEQGQKARFNIPAFLFSAPFCFYRKCGGLFRRYFLLPLLIAVCAVGLATASVIGLYVAGAPETMRVLSAISLVLSAIASLWMLVNGIRLGFRFNREYLAHCKEVYDSGNSKRNGTSALAVIGYLFVAGLIEAAVVLLAAVITLLLLGASLNGFPAQTGDSTVYADEQDGVEAAEDDAQSAVPFASAQDQSARQVEHPTDLQVSTDYFTVTLPSAWENQYYYEVEQNPERYSLLFYESESYDYDNGSGCLFVVALFPSTVDYTLYPSYELAGQVTLDGTAVNVVILYPTDVQYIPSAQTRYSEMAQDAQTIVDSIQFFGNCPDFSVDSDYLFPSDTQYITTSDLSGLDEQAVKLILNEIYARHGYVFQSESYAQYFSAKSWYVPNENFSTDQFNAVEKQNVETIVAYEKEMGWRS